MQPLDPVKDIAISIAKYLMILCLGFFMGYRFHSKFYEPTKPVVTSHWPSDEEPTKLPVNPNEFQTGLLPSNPSIPFQDVFHRIPPFELSEMGKDALDKDGHHSPFEEPQEDGPKLNSPRSGKWPTVRKNYLAIHPRCEACGSTDNLAVHHIKPFHTHPELELDFTNLITLCYTHHFELGHHKNWKTVNPYVKEDAKRIKDHTYYTAP